MTNLNSPGLQDVFCKLDRWRHLPGYRLEPNLAPFFGLFLPKIMHYHSLIESESKVVPEFPLRLGTIGKGKAKRGSNVRQGDNQSVKVDFLIFQNDPQKVFLVELKSDENSFSPDQFCSLLRARDVGLHRLLQGVLKICKNTNQKLKYAHLLHVLTTVGLLDFQYEEIIVFDKGKPLNVKRGWSAYCESFCESVPSLCDENLPVHILYITPSGNELKCDEERCPGVTNCEEQDCRDTFKTCTIHEIGFCEVANAVEGQGAFGIMFANYLRKWKETPAGEIDPRNFRSAP